MLTTSHVEIDERGKVSYRHSFEAGHFWTDGSIPVADCPRCGTSIINIKGSRLAVCRNCGWKDDCC